MGEKAGWITGICALLFALCGSTAAAEPDDGSYYGSRTVAEVIAENGGRPPSDWVARLDAAGLDHLPLTEVNRVAFEICDRIWVGGEYDKIIDQLTWDYKRPDAIALYGVAAGWTCNLPPGAVPGIPK